MIKVLNQEIGQNFAIYNGDCVDVLSAARDGTVDFSIFSPPFASLYTYSNSERDMGNCADGDEFARHFAHLVPHLMRVLRPGRLLAMHCMQLPTSKARDGVIGLRDFRGDLIRIFEAAGFVYHSEVVIWKNPVTAMQRTKALGLLHKQIRKDSAMSRQGIPDYLVVMRKPGVNDAPIAHADDSFPVERWQRYASPVWGTWDDIDDENFVVFRDPRKCDQDGEASGILPSETLQCRSAREEEDERHICPLQLPVIRRAVKLWTNPGDVVLSPFAGIGSEGYVSLQEKRRFLGAELKTSYYEQAVKNLRTVDTGAGGKQLSMFEAS